MKPNSYIKAFVDFIYPRYCAGCNNILLRNEEEICLKCLYHLPKTKYAFGKENKTEQIFWGRLDFNHAISFLHFEKGNLTQRIMHKFKYQHHKNIGYSLGKIFGAELLNTSFSEVDCLVPVPLHPKKYKTRGYNQSQILAQGFAEAMQKKVYPEALKRTDFNDTQTKKGRYARWKNVESIFAIEHAETLREKHVLLIDDIVTTGSTLEAAANCMIRSCNCSISIATLAITGAN